jgi:hypothetical protein
MDGADGGRLDLVGQPAEEQFAQLASAPVWFVFLEADDQGLQLGRQLVGIAIGASRAVGDRGDAFGFVSAEDFVAGFAGDPGFAAEIAHALAVEEAGDEAKAFVHDRTLFPRHRRLPGWLASQGGVTHVSGTNCHLCLGTLKVAIASRKF